MNSHAHVDSLSTDWHTEWWRVAASVTNRLHTRAWTSVPSGRVVNFHATQCTATEFRTGAAPRFRLEAVIRPWLQPAMYRWRVQYPYVVPMRHSGNKVTTRLWPICWSKWEGDYWPYRPPSSLKQLSVFFSCRASHHFYDLNILRYFPCTLSATRYNYSWQIWIVFLNTSIQLILNTFISVTCL